MITELNISNFKSLRDVKLKLGPLNLFIGANASGKSNFFDALRVLQGIGNGYTVSEVFNGRPEDPINSRWQGIRGGIGKALYSGCTNEDLKFGIKTSTPLVQDSCVSYSIEISTVEKLVKNERMELITGGKTISLFSISNNPRSMHSTLALDRYASGRQESSKISSIDLAWISFLIDKVSDAIDKINGHGYEHCDEAINSLVNIQHLDFSPALLRQYSTQNDATRIGSRGENFAAVAYSICKNPDTKSAFLSWMKHMRPSEVDDVTTIFGAMNEPMFAVIEGKNTYPAPVLSDGTLRFAAFVAAMMQPIMPKTMTIEEIENGIHASRLRLLVELLRNVTSQGKTQVFATTHSPTVISWLKEEDYAHTFFCKRNEETGETRIVPLSEIPNFLEIVKHQSAGDLFAEGWMENAL